MTVIDPTETVAVLQEKQRIEKAGRIHGFHWAIILASLFLTVTAWHYTRSQNDTQVQNRFDREAQQVVNLVTERLHKYEDVLWSGVAATQSHDKGMTAEKWARFSRTLNIGNRYPGINGIGVIDHLNLEDVNLYLEQQRATRPNFNIFPEHTRSERFPIRFVEPLSMNAAAVGLDVAHEDNRYFAAIKARETGTAQITGPITLVQDAKKTPGFLFYAPFYSGEKPTTQQDRDKQFEGLIYAPFIFERLMRGTLNTEQRLVGLSIVDDGKVLFDESTREEHHSSNHLYETTFVQDIYGRKWTFTVWSKKSFNIATHNNKPVIILASGLLIEALIIGLFLLLAKSNRRAVTFAGHMADAHETQKIYLENILENAVDGIMTLDAEGRIQNFNKACEDIFGYTSDMVTERNVSLLFPDLKDIYAEMFTAAGPYPTEGEVSKKVLGQSREGEGRLQNGRYIPMDISISEINVEGDVIYNVIVRDISRRKRAEKDLNRMMKNLILSNEDLEKFAYSASHDLKSPLRAIDNLSQWIDEDLGDTIDEENKNRLKMLRSRINRMEQLLDDMLNYSRAGHNADEAEPITAGQLAKDVTELLNIPEGFTVTIDPALNDIEITRMPLEQVFHNLINNAIKHHDKPTGAITITGAAKGVNFEFEISDDGPGIPPEFHGKIFEMFQTLKSRDQVEGSGMGLAMVKKIILQNGGHIHLKSSPETGTTFVITWPKTLIEASEFFNDIVAKSA